MSLTHATVTRNALADKITTLLGATGKLRFRASTTTIVDINLANPAFGAASGGTAHPGRDAAVGERRGDRQPG
jgi:hypothetical protein